MAKDPAFLFYVSDFLTGTMMFSHDQVGRYVRLLCIQHQNSGRIDADDFEALAGLDKKIRSKFISDANGFFNERLDFEIKKRRKDTDASRENGSLGGRPKKPKQNPQVILSDPKQNLTERVIENENTNEIEIRNSVIEIQKKETFDNFEQFMEWGRDCYKGNDFHFLSLLKNNQLEPDDAKNHIQQYMGLLAEYPNKQPSTQQRFRMGFMRFILEQRKNKKPERIGTINKQSANSLMEYAAKLDKSEGR